MALCGPYVLWAFEHRGGLLGSEAVAAAAAHLPTADYFGAKHFGMNYGWIFTAYGVAGILGPAVGGVLFDATGQYIIPFIFAGTLCFLAAGMSVVIWGLARHYHPQAA